MSAEPRTLNPEPSYTPAQMRLLHRLARDKGIDHEELRAVAGVRQSLTELNRDSMAQLITRLQADRPQPRRRRLPPGVIRPATTRQRHAITALMNALGWPEHVQAGWLRNRHNITDVASGAYSTKAASEVITQLQLAVAKRPNRQSSIVNRQSEAEPLT